MKRLHQFASDENGSALVLVAVMLPVLVGFAVLAIDVSRVNGLHNDLQSGADAIALAAAAELDTNSDAITRATRAAASLVANNYLFSGTGGSAPLVGDGTGVTLRFLTSLPPNDANPITSSYVTTDPTKALFVEVTTKPVNFHTIFPVSFIGGNGDMTVATVAVAGFAGIVVCNMTPVFICDPFKNADGTGMGFTQAVLTGHYFGRTVTLTTKGASWGPGNFGFLRPSSNPGYGDSDLSKDLARGTVQECVNSLHLYASPGNMTTNDVQGFNTRFDMYGSGNSFPSKTDANWPAAYNVRKGYNPVTTAKNGKTTINACNATPSIDTANFMALPKDSGTDPAFTSGIVGNGVWAQNYSTYLSVNNMSSTVGNTFKNANGVLYSDSNRPSRFDLYKYEYTSGAYTTLSKGQESGAPLCTSNISTDPDRRLVYGAIVDCSDPTNISALNGASGTTLKAEGYGSFFMISPVTTSIVTEAVDVTGRAGRGSMTNFARDNVQLYR